MVAAPVLKQRAYALLVRDRAARSLAPDPWYGAAGAARANQRPPAGDWTTWLLLAGRGFGKTRTAAEWVRWKIQHGAAGRVALLGATGADVRDVMVEGPSGLVACCRAAGLDARYEPSRRRVVFGNGALAFAYSAEEPDRLRGPQHDGLWADEVAAFPDGEALDQAQFGLRLGSHPQQVLTTTPKPVPHLRALLRLPGLVTTRGSTYDNIGNMAPGFRAFVDRFEGTRLGRQELAGELLDDVEGALWSLDLIDRGRVSPDDVPDLVRVVVAVDPQAAYEESGDLSETGIVVAGVCAERHLWVLADLSGNLTPGGWGARAVAAQRDHAADRIVAEANQGGEMVRHTLETVDPLAPVAMVRASRGKIARAEPVAALYEQGRAHHAGSFPRLEDQMTTYVPGTSSRSPDRMDALVWAATSLVLDPAARPMVW